MTETSTIGPPADVFHAGGESCATLTPRIRARLRNLADGQVLEVRTDDQSAREEIPAWCRLTGNELVATVEVDNEHTLFYIRKK